MQPQEVQDASTRIAYLALTETTDRPKQPRDPKDRFASSICAVSDTFRIYDAVGPETMSIMEMLRRFAKAQGRTNFRHVFIGYRNMEKVLNIKSLGNLNRQFVSLLRSEQDAKSPVIGDPRIWENLLGRDSRLMTVEEAFSFNELSLRSKMSRRFPYLSTARWVMRNPKVIVPGISLSLEILHSYFINQNKVIKN